MFYGLTPAEFCEAALAWIPASNPKAGPFFGVDRTGGINRDVDDDSPQEYLLNAEERAMIDAFRESRRK